MKDIPKASSRDPMVLVAPRSHSIPSLPSCDGAAFSLRLPWKWAIALVRFMHVTEISFAGLGRG